MRLWPPSVWGHLAVPCLGRLCSEGGALHAGGHSWLGARELLPADQLCVEKAPRRCRCAAQGRTAVSRPSRWAEGCSGRLGHRRLAERGVRGLGPEGFRRVNKPSLPTFLTKTETARPARPSAQPRTPEDAGATKPVCHAALPCCPLGVSGNVAALHCPPHVIPRRANMLGTEVATVSFGR